MNILMVEDNESIVKGLVYMFNKNGMEIIHKSTVDSAIDYIGEKRDFEFVILDVGLPDGDGITLFKEYICDLDIPTIFLTANDDEESIVRALDYGAWDYITKPFSTKELIARINRIIRRTKKTEIITVGDISYDSDKMVVLKNGKEVELTSLELKIVGLMFFYIDKVVNRNIILDKIWEWTGNYVDDHTVTVYFKRIRQKLDTDIIKTVKGVGYRIDKE